MHTGTARPTYSVPRNSGEANIFHANTPSQETMYSTSGIANRPTTKTVTSRQHSTPGGLATDCHCLGGHKEQGVCWAGVCTYQNHSLPKLGTENTPQWMKMPNLAWSNQEGRGRLSRDSHVGSYRGGLVVLHCDRSGSSCRSGSRSARRTRISMGEPLGPA